jgi:hypothetical protein
VGGQRLDIDVGWEAKNLLSRNQLNFYNKTMEPYEEKYYSTIGDAWYDRCEKFHHLIYVTGLADFEAYNKVVNTLESRYKEIEYEALYELQLDRAQAFFKACKISRKEEN